MFYGLENTQPEISDLLEKLIRDNNLPSVLLFEGQECSSRMFAALAVSKAFGADSFSTLIISDRNHSFRISSALNLFRKNRNSSAGRFLRESVDTYLKQFHGAFSDNTAPAGKKKFSDAAQCRDLIDEIERTEEKDIPSFCDKLEKALSSLLNLNGEAAKGTAVTVSQVRSIRDWCSTSALDGKPKVVILEGLENSTDSASNALLKTLEEPPSDTRFILISANSGRIPATILSRVRKFHFKPFTDKEKAFVLNSLFINPSEYEDLKSFFVRYSGVDDRLLVSCAHSLVFTGNFDLVSTVRELEKTQAWDRFFEHVINELNNATSEGKLQAGYAEHAIDAINKSVNGGKTYNQVKRLTFDRVVYCVKEVIRI